MCGGGGGVWFGYKGKKGHLRTPLFAEGPWQSGLRVTVCGNSALNNAKHWRPASFLMFNGNSE